MHVLGIDPGIGRTGWGMVGRQGGKVVALGFGCIETPPSLPHEQRLAMLFDGVHHVIASFQPASVGVEKLFFYRNVNGIAVGEARGVALLACAQAGLVVHEYAPPEVKQAVVGVGRADKKQVTTMVQRILALSKPPTPDDTADALAIALCELHSQPFFAAVRQSEPPLT